jgi:hypothetical protein
MATSPHRAVGDSLLVLQWCFYGLLEKHREAREWWTLRIPTFSWMIIFNYPLQISRHSRHRSGRMMVLRRNPSLWCLLKIYKNGLCVHDILLNSSFHCSPKDSGFQQTQLQISSKNQQIPSIFQHAILNLRHHCSHHYWCLCSPYCLAEHSTSIQQWRLCKLPTSLQSTKVKTSDWLNTPLAVQLPVQHKSILLRW